MQTTLMMTLPLFPLSNEVFTSQLFHSLHLGIGIIFGGIFFVLGLVMLFISIPGNPRNIKETEWAIKRTQEGFGFLIFGIAIFLFGIYAIAGLIIGVILIIVFYWGKSVWEDEFPFYKKKE